MISMICDTETTGLPMPSSAPLDHQPRIIEFGALMVCGNGKEAVRYSQLINPGVPISAEITKITGITNDDLVGKPSFSECLPIIRMMAEDCDCFIAHNASFDKGLIEFELQRLGVEDFPWPKHIICTVEEFEPLFGHRPRLIELYKRFVGEELKQTHRAIDDVDALHAALMAASFYKDLEFCLS